MSIGLVAIDGEVESVTTILSAADSAMYAAKDRGRNRFHVYEAGDQDLVRRNGDMQWVSKIIKALEENRFRLYCQAITPIKNKYSGYHYEILLRLQGENGVLVAPMAFIPAAERYNLMPQIDRWVVSSLFASLKDARHQIQSLYTVNLSGASFNDDNFLDFLKEQFSIYQIPPQKICFEVTETVAISNLNKATRFIRQLKKLGCCFALDDFGTGMSSLAYLKNLPVDYLKIDGHFIRNIVEDPINTAMVEAINRIGHIMGLQTIAEFVEDDAILAKIKDLHIDYAQGYRIAKPCPFEAIAFMNYECA